MMLLNIEGSAGPTQLSDGPGEQIEPRASHMGGQESNLQSVKTSSKFRPTRVQIKEITFSLPHAPAPSPPVLRCSWG